METSRRTIAAACGALLAGCGGTATSFAPFVPPAHAIANVPARARAAATATGTLTLTIRIAHQHVKPRSISPATGAVRVVFTGASKVTEVLGLTPASNHGCKAAAGTTTCTIDITLNGGSYKAGVTTYDRAPVHGSIPGAAHVLATATGVRADVKTGKHTAFKLTLDGAPASFALTVPSATAGTPFATPQRIDVTARDADGYAIVGDYATPVTVTDGDNSGATSIATSGSGHPPAGELTGSADSATLSYTGLAVAPVAIDASALHATSTHAAFAPALAPIVVTTSDTLNPHYAGVDLFARSGNGSSAALSVSEIGWSNAPYDRAFGATPSAACSHIATIAPAAGTSFTATVVAAPAPATCALTLTDGAGRHLAATIAYTRFVYSGAQESIVAPTGVTKMTVTADGAAGGSANSVAGGDGGSIVATLTATSGQRLFVEVGGEGGTSTLSEAALGGFNGGANATDGGGGGGASDVYAGSPDSSVAAIIAGGGGGTGAGPVGVGAATYGGGAGGGVTGGTGGGPGGGGGTQNAGGTISAYASVAGSDGTFGSGGSGSSSGGGGGGGGYYGGAGGNFFVIPMEGSAAGGGGGGSSFVRSDATNVTSNQGTQTGNGLVVIVW